MTAIFNISLSLISLYFFNKLSCDVYLVLFCDSPCQKITAIPFRYLRHVRLKSYNKSPI